MQSMFCPWGTNEAMQNYKDQKNIEKHQEYMEDQETRESGLVCAALRRNASKIGRKQPEIQG